MNTDNPTKPSILQTSAAYIRSLFVAAELAKADANTPYRIDEKGRHCPSSTVSAVDAARDDLVNATVAQWKEEQLILRDIKATGFANIEAFLATSLADYGVKKGMAESGVTLFNFAQTKKIVISYAKIIRFSEELMAAKLLIEELITEKSADVDEITKALLMNAFNLNDGKLNTAEILKLRRIEIKHPKWELAMQAIADAILPIGSKGYVRVYERANIDSEWEAISLDIAAL